MIGTSRCCSPVLRWQITLKIQWLNNKKLSFSRCCLLGGWVSHLNRSSPNIVSRFGLLLCLSYAPRTHILWGHHCKEGAGEGGSFVLECQTSVQVMPFARGSTGLSAVPRPSADETRECQGSHRHLVSKLCLHSSHFLKIFSGFWVSSLVRIKAMSKKLTNPSRFAPVRKIWGSPFFSDGQEALWHHPEGVPSAAEGQSPAHDSLPCLCQTQNCSLGLLQEDECSPAHDYFFSHAESQRVPRILPY